MTICKECASKRNMFSMTRVLAKCELCGQQDVCIDVHHSRVPVLATEGIDPYLRAGSVGYIETESDRLEKLKDPLVVMRGPRD